MNKKELLNLSERKWDNPSVYDSILLVPTGKKHDSEWMVIAIIGIIGNEPKEIAAYCDDICWKNIPNDGYSFRTDCFYPSGIIRIWVKERYQLEVGISISSTDVKVLMK